MTVDILHLLTPKQAAERLQVSLHTLRGYVNDGSLTFVNMGRGDQRRHMAFDPVDLDEFVRNRKRRLTCPQSTGRRVRNSTTSTSGSRVVSFLAQQRERASARLEAVVPQIERQLRVELKSALDPSTSLTLDAVAGRYMLDVGDHHVGADNTRRLVALLVTHFGPAKLITEITHEDAQGLIRWRRSHTVGKKKPRPISAYAVNDTVEQLKKLFTYLRPGLERANPDKKVFPLEPDGSKLWLDEPKRKPRELVGDEEERLVKAIYKERPDLWPLIEFAHTGGKRKTNCYTLTWDQVDWSAGIVRMLGKGRGGGKPMELAISPSLRAILEPLVGHHPKYVFTFEARRNTDKIIKGRRHQFVKGERHPWTRDGLRVPGTRSGRKPVFWAKTGSAGTICAATSRRSFCGPPRAHRA